MEAGPSGTQPAAVAPGRSLLKSSKAKDIPLIDMTDDDPGLEVLKVVPGKSGLLRGGGAGRGVGLPGLPGASGAATPGFPYLSSGVLRAQDPFQGSSPTDILAKCEL